MAELVSKRYALALFEAGLDLDKIDEFNKELDFLQTVFDQEEQLLQLLSHPRIKKDEKKDLINRIFKDKLSQELVNFIYILIDKRREAHIIDIITKYKELFNEHKNIIIVVAMTAVPMEEKARNKLVEVLASKLDKTVELTNEIDKSVIGGVVLNIENKVVDGSLKGQLDSLSKILLGTNN